MKNSAFTLVELAIVVVIIGLITGGILGAQSLIKSSRVQSVVKSLLSYDTAIKAFQLEYDALPGDMKDAYDYFGSDCGDDDALGSGCNGDGNKNIANLNIESCNFFEHLSMAEIVPGSYNCGHMTSIEIEKSWPLLFDQIGVRPSLAGAWGTNILPENANRLVVSGLFNFTGSGSASNGRDDLDSQFSKAVDKKIDDGIASNGKLVALSDVTEFFSGNKCTDSANAEIMSMRGTYDYDVASDKKVCFLFYEFSR